MALSVAAAPVLLFSVYVDGNQECCQAKKVRTLKSSFKALRAWFTGQIKDQSLGTRADIPFVRVDLTFEGINGGIGSLQVMNVPVNSLHSQGYKLIECEPCTRPVLPWQHEREGRWWWDAMAECDLHKLNGHVNGAAYTNGSATLTDIFMPGIENQAELWLALLYALWCRLCQAMEESCINLAEKLMGNGGKNMQSKICSLIAFPQRYIFAGIPPGPSNIPLKRGMLNHQWLSLLHFNDNDHHLSVQN